MCHFNTLLIVNAFKTITILIKSEKYVSLHIIPVATFACNIYNQCQHGLPLSDEVKLIVYLLVHSIVADQLHWGLASLTFENIRKTMC
jgi:hypothetical protein